MFLAKNYKKVTEKVYFIPGSQKKLHQMSGFANMFRHVWLTCLACFANVFGVFGLWAELIAHVRRIAPTCFYLLASCDKIFENMVLI
jgi:hypothetical protein